MGLFSFFRKNGHSPSTNGEETITVPKDLFVEESDPSESVKIHMNGTSEVNLDAIYSYLQQDYETRGYNDALTNAEESYKKDNVELIYMDLRILIERAYAFYENLIANLDYHIDTRSRSGLVDLVEELKSRKETVQKHQEKIREIEAGVQNSSGLSKRAELSYTRGFHKGLVAITQSQILK
ncbi:hypothetical protein [Robiginitalea biformata]|nr:hypothetical protein [Robiginitalea biformata]